MADTSPVSSYYNTPASPFRQDRPASDIKAELDLARTHLKNAYTIMMRPSREAFLGGRRRDNRGLTWRMCQKFERSVERLGNELFRARLFEQWISDVVIRTIGDEREEEEEDEDEEMEDEEGGDEMEGVEQKGGGEEKEDAVREKEEREEAECIARVAARSRWDT